MAYEKRTPRHDWRSQLTPDEKKVVEHIEAEMQGAARFRADLAAKLNPIRNRAIQRVRYQEKVSS